MISCRNDLASAFNLCYGDADSEYFINSLFCGWVCYTHAVFATLNEILHQYHVDYPNVSRLRFGLHRQIQWTTV